VESERVWAAEGRAHDGALRLDGSFGGTDSSFWAGTHAAGAEKQLVEVEAEPELAKARL
jgi:hypothetical protein